MVEIGGTTRWPNSPKTCAEPSRARTRTFDVKYADDFSDKRLAGKTMSYEVNIKGIKTATFPS